MDVTGDFEQLLNGLPHTEPQLLRKARDAMVSGRNDIALKLLTSAVQRASTTNLQIALGHVLFHERRHKDAMAQMVSILREEPRNAEALILLTDSLIECAEYSRAEKMLARAEACGADREECERLADKLSNLLGETASNIVGLSARDESTRDALLDPTRTEQTSEVEVDRNLSISKPAERKRMNTMQGGRPAPQWDVGDPRGDAPENAPPVPGPSTTPETLRSGSFSNLSGWSDDDTIESGLFPGPDAGSPPPPTPTDQLSDDEFERALGDVFDEFEVQPTMAFVPDEVRGEPSGQQEYASPNDQTAAIVFEDDELRSLPPSGVNDSSEAASGSSPSVEYDTHYGQEVERLGAEITEEPTRERESHRPGWPDGDANPTSEEVPSRRGITPIPRRDESPSGSTPRSEPSPRQSGREPGGHSGFQAPAPAYGTSESAGELRQNPFGSPSIADPGTPAPRRKEPTGLTPSASSSGGGDERGFIARRWPLLLVAGTFVTACALVGTALLAAYMQSSEMETMLAAAEREMTRDTYTGYIAAEESLSRAVTHTSFLGSTADDIVRPILPAVPGVEAPNLQRTAIAKRAYVSALLEFRYEKEGAREAARAVERANEAAPARAESVAASAYQALASGHPHQALGRLADVREELETDLLLDQVRVEAHLNLNQPAAAALAVKNFRALEQPTLYQRLLVAEVDLALGDPSAGAQLAAIRKDADTHIDARIAHTYTMLEGEESREEAARSLDTIEKKLRSSVSQYQLARVSIARAALAEAAGEAGAVEESYRKAVRKMPSRPELYLPLVDHLFEKSAYEDVSNILAKAESEGANHPLLTIARARLLILESAPAEVNALFEEANFDDPRKDFYLGLAALELGDIQAAATHFEAGTGRRGDFPANDAFLQVAKALQEPSEAEKAAYQIDRLASKHPRDAFVHWASALVRLAMADQEKERSAFEETLDKAEKELEEAIELEPGWPLFHYALCDVHLRGLEGKDAARACKKGRDLAPGYLPGLLTFAELRLQQGRFEQAAEIVEQLTERRPDNDRVTILAARVAIERGNLQKAEETINALLGNPISNSFEMKLLEGRLAYARRNYPKASGYLASANELRPQDGEAGIYYARTLARLGKLEEAEEVIKNHLSDRVWAPAAWTAFAEVRRRQDRYDDAFENLRIARKKLTDDIPPATASELYRQYALTFRDKYDWNHPQVIARLQTGLDEGDPDDADIHFMRGLYYLKRRQPNEEAAASAFRKVVESAPWRCDAVEPLRKLYEKQEKDEEAKSLAEIVDESCEAKK